jgi:hypothetical protein
VFDPAGQANNDPVLLLLGHAKFPEGGNGQSRGSEPTKVQGFLEVLKLVEEEKGDAQMAL